MARYSSHNKFVSQCIVHRWFLFSAAGIFRVFSDRKHTIPKPRVLFCTGEKGDEFECCELLHCKRIDLLIHIQKKKVSS